MNTQAELQQAARELHAGTFITAMLQLHRAMALLWARRPIESRHRCGRSVNSIRGTFAHEVLNICYAIGDLDQEDRRDRQASRVRRESLR